MSSSTDDTSSPTSSTVSFENSEPPLHYVVTHVFLPVKPPDESDYTAKKDHSLAEAVCTAAHAYGALVCGTYEQAQWQSVTEMLENLAASVQSDHLETDHAISRLREMQTGDILILFIRHQGAAILLTKRDSCTLCELFEVSPSEDAVNEMPGPLICSYPESAVEMPNEVFHDENFLFKLANFLSPPNALDSDVPRNHPQYMDALLNSVLLSAGRVADVPRIVKHVHDYPHDGPTHVWRRSPLWLLIRLAIQTSVNRCPSLGCPSYKRFVLFFMCTLSRDADVEKLSTDLLHLMSSRILRRLSKIRSAPDWLSEMALTTSAALREILDARWKELRTRTVPFHNPSQEELTRDSQLTLLHSREYIRDILENHDRELVVTPFNLNHHRRSTIHDFLSSDGTFFEKAYAADPAVTICDVERSVEEGIDDWLGRVTNVDEACAQLEILMDQYVTRAYGLAEVYAGETSLEEISIQALTTIELYVALDKLAMKRIPMLADYPPQISIALLEILLLRKTTSLHRLSRAYQYLAARHSQSRPGWSVLSNEFTEHSFPVRYYDQSPDLQELKARIEEDAIKNHLPGQQQTRSSKVSRSPLPTLPLHAKVVVFELQCPPCIRSWRSAAPRILRCLFHDRFLSGSDQGEGPVGRHLLLSQHPTLRPYHVQRQGPLLHVQMHFAYFHLESSQPHNTPTFRHIVQYPTKYKDAFSIWGLQDQNLLFSKFDKMHVPRHLEKCAHSTTHTSNDVLSSLADCPRDLSLDEFIECAHLRSGGTLQWINILQGLRSRTLNLRHNQVHYLLYRAALQVGPLDLNSGMWLWHQELQDLLYCNALLDELELLFVEVGTGLMDSVLMDNISLLLTRVLSSSPREDISGRAIALLRRVCKKTFGWVQELSYDLVKAPTKEGRRLRLCRMATACRSTFDVDHISLRKLFQSPEDVDALVSCAFFLRALSPNPRDYSRGSYSEPFLNQCRRSSLALEDVLRDEILADPSGYAVDLAVAKIFVSYQPGPLRWEQVQYPNNRWIRCETEATVDQCKQTIHINLLNGELRLAGQPLSQLSAEKFRYPRYQQIFQDQGLFIVPSNLPGMDFMTTPMTSTCKVHFSLRGGDLKLRAQLEGNRTNYILALIPWNKLWGDLPQALVDGHVHWLNLSEKVIEIRPFGQVWEASPTHWKIDCASGQYRMYRGHETLVDIRSPTWAMVSECFECLDNGSYESSDYEFIPFQTCNLIVSASPIASSSPPRLSLTLPRYSLSFFVNNQGELESHDFKHMVYDENRDIGALFGPVDLLVLRQKTIIAGTLVPEDLIPRRVIIRNGLPTRRGDRQVQIDEIAGQLRRSLYNTYIVDTELGCLTGDGNLETIQFLACLHAMTSWHRPDPLTEKTGTQAALDLLQLAGFRSIMRFRDFDGRLVNTLETTQYYQLFSTAFKEIGRRYYWSRRHKDVKVMVGAEQHAKRRIAELFPLDARGAALPEGHDFESNFLPEPPLLSPTVSPLRYLFNAGSPRRITLDDLICNRPAPAQLPGRISLPRASYATSSRDDIHTLNQLFSSLRTATAFQRDYLAHLDASTRFARVGPRVDHRVAGEDPMDTLKEHYVQCRATYLDSLDILKKSLGPTTDPSEQALHLLGQWPPITADVLLRYLATTSLIVISPRWKKCLTSLALLLSDLQRSRRLLRYTLDGLDEELSKELENEGCDGWSAEEYPDWLLIQIQGNFLIRPSQAETAMEIMHPQSGQNTVMQVNMGEGKSSVIIPIAAAALADGKQLVRVIVPRALTMQMFDILVARLGGLANRPTFHLPFSRTIEYSGSEVISIQFDDLHKLMQQCMAERGILLVQPEHVVSLKLMSVEEQLRDVKLAAHSVSESHSLYKHITTALRLKSLSNDSIVGNMFRRLRQSPSHSSKSDATQAEHHDQDTASKWLSLQKWIHCHVRDILDESDEILHSRFQLVYTLGSQQHVDGYPDRWTITQQILRLVKKHVYSLSEYAPDSMQYECSPPGSFPHVRIMRASDVGQRLISLVTTDVMAGLIPNFSFQHISAELHDAIRSFISDKDVFQIPATVKRVEDYAKNSDQNHLWGGLLLLRGLLTSNILLYALSEQRWNVDYGLPWRFGKSMLAVPYRAKHTAARNTQFGHPDLTIILTCLSYYYAGLNEDQLRTSFEILLDQGDPSKEYALWIEESESVPDPLRKLSDINLRLSEQWSKVVFPLFAWNQATIDFYLSRVVFPREAKEFPLKMSGSIWDLAEKREKLITGFSGTNDGRWLLPTSIAQRDPAHQQGTHASILAYLLQHENGFYMVTHKSNAQWNTRAFLRLVTAQEPKIRVLLDVGSAILDLSNRGVAELWLTIACDAAGAVYFDVTNELMVLTRNGTASPILSSPLSEQLERCVVYLDHAHTRGTDIKLPIGSRAAVTLGPKVTKDALVQGCMRMRKLGHGHSVMFFAPPKIDWNIRAVSGKIDPSTKVTTVDVLCWAIHETWADIQHRAPYWAHQGMRHKTRQTALIHFYNDDISTKQLSDAWLQPELKSLNDLYAPRETKDTQSDLSALDPGIRQRCKNLGVLSLSIAQLEEEQEREVHREREREREVEVPPRAKPAEHSLHPDVVSFVNTGVLPPLHSGSAFLPVFMTLKNSTAATRESDVWSPFILATADFCRTIKPESTRGTMDQYLRPVQWIVSRQKGSNQVLVLLSPFEADQLLPDIRASEHVHLHVYAPRTSLRMKPSDDLRLYSIPPLLSDWSPPWALIDQLNVFAGQLYLRDYRSYLRLCRFLDIPTKYSSNDPSVRRNLFNIPGGLDEMEITFSSSPLPSVMALLAVRSRGRPFAQTHMGKILQGQVLTAKDFEGPTQLVEDEHDPESQTAL